MAFVAPAQPSAPRRACHRVRPQRAKEPVGAYQASLAPLASIRCERLGTLPPVPSLRRARENAAGRHFHHPLGMFLHPDFPFRSMFQLPDRRNLLKLIDRPFACSECVGTVLRTGDDQHNIFTDRDFAIPMDDKQL